MSICRWCTPGASCTTDFLSNYASKRLPPEDLAAASDDLCYCLECVVEYHKARDEVPSLHETLWELETSRLIAHMEKSMKEEIEEDDELFIVDENGETQLSGYTGPDFENNLRVPLLEILKYPYLLLHKRIGELCVEALCKMEQANSSFQVFEKHPGIYLLLVHPNEVIRRWAILTARNLGKVDRDDYYDLQEVLTCLFKVIELGLFDSPDIYCSSVLEKGKLILLPSHLYDSASYKNYWLGICMLLTVLEEQAMDSLLLGPDKQNDFMQSILHTMEKQTDDDNADPFWPALHCFMVILDQLGSKVWGQLIDPVQAFQTIINNVSYNNEIQNIRNSSRRPKTEPESEYGEDMVTCSQIVYNYNTEKPKKDAGWKTAICPDYCPNMYEDMQTLANVLQSDIGQDMRVHNNCPSNQVIIISDSSSDDEKKIVIEKQTEKIDESICPEKQPLTSACVSDGVSKKEQMKSHSSPLPYEEYESQYFEFETEDDVFSVWQDSQMDDKNMNQAREQVPPAGSCSSNNLQLEDETNEWGYDTDYISDDIIEQAAKDAEKQISSVFYQKKTRPKPEGRGKNRVGSSESRKKRLVKRADPTAAIQQPTAFDSASASRTNQRTAEQSDPVDMEMCSQLENIIILPSKEPLEMEVNAAESLLQNDPSNIVMYHLFVKPLPPKVAKPPTTKIFSSNSSSRSASLTKDLEKSSKFPLVSKNKLNAVKPAASKPSNTLITVQRDPTIFVKEVLKWNYEIFANFGSFGPPNNLLQAIVASVPVKFQGYNDYFDTFFPLMMLNAFETLAQEWQESQKAKEKNAYHLHLKKFSADLNQAEFTVYIRERDLVKQLHPKEDDLIFLVVREKQNPLAEESEMDCCPVRHVGHVTRFSRTSFREMGQNEQHIVCHLFVQTRGNLSSYINQQVKCEVVSSLVTTQRKFRGLLLLGRSPLAKAIVHPNYNDFCPRDLSTASERTTSYYKEYNEDQKKAIETAYAMVKQHPGLPRICLIHGPPGTGKSKTIVGLLFRILNEKSGKENPAQNMNAKIKRNRVLVCAPSNAAVDELMKKIILEFKEKCQNKKNPLGNCGDINLVRLGPQKSISIDVLRFSLDSQVSYRMNRGHSGRDQDIHKRKEALDRELDMLARQRAMDRCEKREKSQQLDDEIGRLSKERQELASQLKKVRGRPQEVQGSIILESHIICCTLSTSGGFLLESAFRRQGLDPFSCVIVDEAGQACEVETLIPLIHRCSKLVLVGDPKQLPPTVISMKAQDYGYDQSLMARLHKHLEEQVQQNVIGKLPVVQLTVQYRMHPDICLFPSNYVYGKTLKTDRATEESRCSSDWPFQPYLVFDVADGHEKRDKDSFTNPQEVKLVVELIKTIKEKRKDIGSRNIGIITPYNAQKKIIQQELDREFGKDRAGEVDTVDGFQGRQKDCIIVTCVRANSAHGSIGFLASLQRLNVTITRAKLSLFILGRLKTLMENKDWNELIQDAQRRGAIIKTCDKTYKKDAAKILKFKPALSRPPPRCPSTVLPEKATRGQPCSGSDGQVDVTNKKDSNSSRRQSDSAGPLAQDSGGLKRPQESQGSDARGVTVPTEMKATVQPAVRERLRDPRLDKRTEATGKEQAFKDGKPSPLRNPGMTSPRASDASSAHRSQSSTVPPSVSKADTSTKSSQSERQPDLPVRSSHIARQDHDKNLSWSQKQAGTKSEGDQKNKTMGNKDRSGLCAQRRASERSTEDTGSSSAKRRKISS
ncbi:putative helicase senataxin [Alligator mississippiensis]|uniref:Helicase senataxin n=1 Tax=Alligator mississippiensis TaxID=8496 RepID=A0A151MFN9_ALLMI|nr:putative helicase senataxin [Alligator mississippiensis]